METIEATLLSCLATMQDKDMLTEKEIKFIAGLREYKSKNGRLTANQLKALRKTAVRLITTRPVPGIEI